MLLSVKELKKYFPIKGGVLMRTVGHVHAVDGVSFNIIAGKTLGIVGESGCGKSTLAQTIVHLEKPTSGEIRFDGIDLATLSKKQWKPYRRRIQMIFQDPMYSLNPKHTIEEILMEPLKIHKIGNYDLVKEIMGTVGLKTSMLDRYPHEFSGGQRQRIGIARAVLLKPDLIIADEPVSALDVSVQSQILNLLKTLQRDFKLSYIFIAHDLAVVQYMSDEIAVMYLGKIVEKGNAESIYKNPLHPYTQALISAIPIPDPKRKKTRIVLQGDVPSPITPPSGCHFHPRCPRAMERCRVESPELKPQGDHLVSCHLY